MLTKTGVATAGDSEALLMLAEALADVDAIRAELRAAGYATTTSTGRTVCNPLNSALRAAERRVAALLADFGMVPAARAKVRVPDVDHEAEIAERYFGERKK